MKKIMTRVNVHGLRKIIRTVDTNILAGTFGIRRSNFLATGRRTVGQKMGSHFLTMELTNNVQHIDGLHSSDLFLNEIEIDALQYNSDTNFVTPLGVKVPTCPIQSNFPHTFESNNYVKYIVLHYNVSAHGCYNFQGARIPLENGFNIPLWRSSLVGSHHYQICDFLEFGFPLGTDHNCQFTHTLKNHPSAYAYHKEIDEFISKELKFGGITGPIPHFPFVDMQISPLMTADKDKGKARRICFDLSFPESSVSWMSC